MNEQLLNADHIQPQAQNPQEQTFTQSALSPSFNLSPMQQQSQMLQQTDGTQYDLFYGGVQGFEHQTPGGNSQSADSSHTDPMDKDPFLSLLEQLAQNDGSTDGGPSELEFLLNGQG